MPIALLTNSLLKTLQLLLILFQIREKNLNYYSKLNLLKIMKYRKLKSQILNKAICFFYTDLLNYSN